MVVYLLSVRRGLAAGVGCALLAWFSLASLLVAIDVQCFWVSVAGWVLLVLACHQVVEKRMKIASQERLNVRYTFLQIALRALFGGGVIAFAVLMGKLGGPVLGGVFATFPAVFLSTLIITYRTGGARFSRAVTKALMVSGTINVGLYAILVRYLYPWLGLLYGTSIALVLSWVNGYLVYMFMKARLA